MPARRILLADDHDGLREIIAGLISAQFPDSTIVAVSDGAAALAAFSRHGADLIITDDHMPTMSGRELIRALRVVDRDTDRADVVRFVWPGCGPECRSDVFSCQIHWAQLAYKPS
jgi:CheY-like chemotaxis protein